MNKNSHPLDYLIWCIENDFKPSSFDILNAKDELKKLREKVDDIYLVGWTRINNYGDLYDPRFIYNPYINENTILPIYASKKEFQDKYGKLSK